ncbi:MAG: tail fiber domain-containing protein, partial [Rhodospirillales bacterium]|nr:tail fiber domain-containing protein [Rhodospirillales bacterium]
GTTGSVGAALGNSGGSRNYIGVYGYGLLTSTTLNNNDNRVAGGTFIAEMNGGGSAASSGSVYGIYTKADATGTTASAGIIAGIYSISVGVANQGSIGGYFSATGGTTNYGVYSAAGTNYFNGNVGIGTASPSALLSVGATSQFQINSTGSVAAATGITSSGTITFSSLAGCASGIQTDGSGILSCLPSDQNVKENISNIDSPLEKVLGLNGVRYNYIDKEKYGGQPEFGLIAQQVESVAPELVFTMSQGIKGVKYLQLGALLVEGIKAQQTTINELSNKISALEQSFKESGVVIASETTPTQFTETETELVTEKGLKTLQNISANALVAINAEEFLLQLGENGKFKINAGGQEIFSANAKGKITVLENGAGSTGQAVIEAGQTTIVVSNPGITGLSRIVASPDKFAVYRIFNKVPGVSFTIELDSPALETIIFDYIVIN